MISSNVVSCSCSREFVGFVGDFIALSKLVSVLVSPIDCASNDPPNNAIVCDLLLEPGRRDFDVLNERGGE